ncbi:Tetratricopeptide repeat protein 28 [Oryzias melastigma]|uniref:Tetratricopeptide repeat protein 28 n=1 Tax=Oryzias melastigma TaxID=30732 RepID=A0A834EZP7_ORYME|nr:Tetratricopeptide repeat protein 28 [Oryzias melastigma]
MQKNPEKLQSSCHRSDLDLSCFLLSSYSDGSSSQRLKGHILQHSFLLLRSESCSYDTPVIFISLTFRSRLGHQNSARPKEFDVRQTLTEFSFFGSRSTNRTIHTSSPSSSPPVPSVPVSGSGAASLSKAEFLERVRRSNQACQQGDFGLAVRLYSEALNADPQNCILYSNRSAAYLRLGQYGTALDDAVKARLINPKWPKAAPLLPLWYPSGTPLVPLWYPSGTPLL